jgi:uncharacterized protein (DUF58 family)
MSPYSSRFIDPAVLAGIKSLQLVARVVVDGFLLGLHQSRRPGAGLEFSQHRSYQPGDDLRQLDWKMYARSDRFFIRESDVERSVTVRLVLDASASMAHKDLKLPKFDYARFLVASLGYLAEQQGDTIGFHAVTDSSRLDLPPRRHQHQYQSLLKALERLAPSGTWPAAEDLQTRITATRAREIVVLVSDLHERSSEIRTVLSNLRALGHEVLVLHLMARNELDFTFEGDLAFEDLETGSTVRASSALLRPVYLGRVRRALAELRQDLLGKGIAYELLPTDQPLDHALKGFLTRRLRLP